MTAATHRSGFENLLALLSIATVLIISGMVGTLRFDMGPVTQSLRAVAPEPVLPEDPAANHEVQFRFDQGVALLHAKRYDYAATAFARVVELAPRMPEAYVNLGFALFGQKEYEQAGEAFNTARELRPEQANAYWGLALALEALNDYEGALGAMRSYIHLSTVPNDPFLAKARAALWEWEAKLGRIPSGPDPADAAALATPPSKHGVAPAPSAK